jgi:hypothetical protein
MTQEARRPLHRLTPLRDDPAMVWLTAPQRLRVAVTGWVVWSVFAFLVVMTWFTMVFVLHFGLMSSFLYCSMGVAALAWPLRRVVLRRRNARMAELVRDSTPALGVAIDNLADLEQQADGTLVSVVGWIRARDQIGEPVGGERCVGLSLACHQRYPGVLETLNDFELVDESGRAVLVQVAGARLLGPTNVNLSDAHARRVVVESLDLPVGAVATGWVALVFRVGDPIMAVGFKQVALDPTQSSLRGPPARASVGSLEGKPMLIFPIAAERRPQLGGGPLS